MQNEGAPRKGRRSQVKCAAMRQTEKAGRRHTVEFLARQAREEVRGGDRESGTAQQTVVGKR